MKQHVETGVRAKGLVHSAQHNGKVVVVIARLILKLAGLACAFYKWCRGSNETLELTDNWCGIVSSGAAKRMPSMAAIRQQPPFPLSRDLPPQPERMYLPLNSSGMIPYFSTHHA
jgi:hypothetical protein